MDRRAFLAAAGAALAASAARAGGPGLIRTPSGSFRFGPSTPFTFEALKDRARAMAAEPFVERARVAEQVVSKIDYMEHGRIRFEPEQAIFRGGEFEVTPFHMGRLFPRPVRLHVVSAGASSEFLYDQSTFRAPADSPAHAMPNGAGFAGLRVHEAISAGNGGAEGGDWLAFLGASYFRTSGDLRQYGLSARGIAIDTANPGFPFVEEFPEFTELWVEEGAKGEGPTVYALLDGPGVAGAYRFRTRRKPETIVDVDASLTLRRDVNRLGIAPLTSMFWYSETRPAPTWDWRPEVHDSDGLQLLTGSGERVWRPLNNPRQVSVSAFSDENPRGFGLMQRDRVADHYLDPVLFERRPSLWIEPLGKWGKGSVQLVEIPTRVEFEDNVVAMWVPDGKARTGDHHELSYRMHWCADFFEGDLVRVVATRLDGPAVVDGKLRQRFFVDMKGSAFALEKVVARVTVSRGATDAPVVDTMPGGARDMRRVYFNLDLEPGDKAPVELRLVVEHRGQPISETWLYRHDPFDPPA